MSNTEGPGRLMPPPGGAPHENPTRADGITGPSDRRFGLTIAAVCTVVGASRLVFGRGGWPWWFGVAIVLGLLALCWPAALAPFNRFWLKLVRVLDKVVSPIVIALIFVTTIVPTGILMRLCGRDPLRLKREPGAASYWIAREPPGPAPGTMRNQF